MKILSNLLRGKRKPDARRPPELPLDLLDPVFLADPFPVYAWLRQQAPVAEVAGGGYLLCRHADVTNAFTAKTLGNAPSRFSTLAARNRTRYVAADLAAHIPPFLDMPQHRLARQAVSQAFFVALRDGQQDVHRHADARVAGAAHGPCDLVADIARPFALEAMAGFIGLAPDAAALKRATSAFFHLFAPIRDAGHFSEVNAAMSQIRVDLQQHLTQARADGALTGFLKHLSDVQTRTPDFTDAQIVDNALLVLADGVENIEAGAASLLRVILAHPDTGEAIAQGAPPKAAVREALRLETPGQVIPRVCTAPFVLHGIEIREGVPVFLALGSANRDLDAFPEADLFDPTRDNDARVTFGLGRHRCIGEPLALLMFESLIGALIRRGVTEAAPQRALSYAPRFGHRWPEAMPIILA